MEWAGRAPSLFTKNTQVISASASADLVPLFSSEVSAIASQPRMIGSFVAGLADGVNPCTLNVLLILLSICLLTDRRRVASAGFLFIAGVVGTYLLIGLGLGRILEPLQRGTIIMSLLYIVFGVGLVLLVLRPPTKSLNGIKAALGKWIRNIRKPGMNSLAIFGTGVLSSAFEFVCTGQIYIPYVLYLSSNAPALLIGNLVLHNVAFALPMVALVTGFSFGLSSEAIQRLLKTPIIQKVGLAATVFLGVYFLATGVLGIIS